MNDEQLAREALTVDAHRSTVALFLGMKGRGKSAAARLLFDAWPHDRIVIDPTGNARPDDPDTLPMIAPFPSQIPEPDRETDPPQQRVTIWARIDPASPTFVHDQDAAMSMALYPRSRHKLIWRDEFGLGVSAAKMMPADQAALMSSRHHNASLLLVVQRPRHIPTLAIAQADKIFVFALPNPKDREHIADNAGISRALFEHTYTANQRRSRHAYLLIDRERDVLLDCPPLPGVRARGPAA